MQDFFAALRSQAVALPLRPLLCAAGAAATVAGIYMSMNKRGDGAWERRRPETDDPEQDQAMEPVLDEAKNLTKDLVTACQDQAKELLKEEDTEDPQDLAIEPCLIRSTEDHDDQAAEPALAESTGAPRDQAMERPESPPTAHPSACCGAPGDSLSETEKKIQKLVAFSSQLEDRVRELEGLLSETHRKCEAKATDCEELKRQSVLQSELKDLSQQNEEFLKVCLADVEQKHLKALESITQLEGEKSDLMHQQTKLRAAVQDMGELLGQTYRKCSELTKEREQKQQAHTVLLLEVEEMKKALKQKEELLQVSVADAEKKHQKALESLTQLRGEKSGLMHQLTKQRAAVQDMGELLGQTYRKCSELTKECEQKQDAFDKMNKLLTENEELLKVSLGDAEQKLQKALESITHLEEEKSDLVQQLKRLLASVQEMGKMLAQANRDCDELTTECERLRQGHSAQPPSPEE